ncbi:MAG: quinolinate synthase NadA [Gemmatimonadota bacterium]|nr:quinolinate synthetase [Gemmatimonadota bacterium]MDP6529660.1 quinolinate synthase NadA [Gemmatimonadota bacterium]MDP6802670.1 quinolinate synthase NadA [Gemmatimonadota bacterium]MDP7031669.1 quinolinate synthase NadA [Gemmatimonadota bacterium]
MNDTSPAETPSNPSGIRIIPDMPICQQDFPLDRYQDEFRPYAEEYLALPDRTPESVLPWMDGYIRPALEHFGPEMVLLAHYYMGGEIVKLVERYGGHIADSYELALQTRRSPETRIFVESAVHFMAESIAILAGPDQQVWITNPRSGCTMEMLAKEHMVEPVYTDLRERFGDDLLVVAYMNTSGRVKALAGETGGSVCTSSNARDVVLWALGEGKRILFVPDRHLGEVAAGWAGISREDLFVWEPAGEGRFPRVDELTPADRKRLDGARMILWGSHCGVHTVFTTEQVEYWRVRGHRVLVHPECPRAVVDAADGAGSTKYLWREILNAPAGSCLAVATEGHFVRNAREQAALRGVEVVHMADIPGRPGAMECGCATMSRNDPPHLVGILDLLRRGCPPDINRVLPGDSVDEVTGTRDRLPEEERTRIVRDARAALERMISVVNAAARG